MQYSWALEGRRSSEEGQQGAAGRTVTDIEGPYPISLVVYNSLADVKNLTFNTEIAYRGILLRAMKKIQSSTDEFKGWL
ncbi:hypothetical protein AOLI_G00292280 [Acnodon oligacanthus]